MAEGLKSQEISENRFVIYMLSMGTFRHNTFCRQETLFSLNNLKQKS